MLQHHKEIDQNCTCLLRRFDNVSVEVQWLDNSTVLRQSAMMAHGDRHDFKHLLGKNARVWPKNM